MSDYTKFTGEWLVSPSPDVSPDFQATVGGHPLVARILAQRGITDPETARGFLHPELYRPAPPQELPDLSVAVERLHEAVAGRKRILVWGDFDVDGQTATALLWEGLRKLGAAVDFYIPRRLRESHGIQTARLAELIREQRPDVLLTCDTGISDHEAIDYANRQGLTVIVSDHHDLPPQLPTAAALVNPRRLPDEHPLRSLPGVGVAYKLIEALYAATGRDDEAAQLLDLVALGIVADVAEQTHDTRYLLQRGLACLRHTPRQGIRALADVAGLSLENLSTEDIGFQLGPRLNAAGRLGDAAQAVKLLTTEDAVQARVLAANLDALNRQRRVMQQQILAAAQEQITAQPDLLDHTALVLHHPSWHPGLLGVVAGELAERYQRPCVLLASPEGDMLARGSARSVPGYDIGQAIAAQADLLHAYGGHPGAAGLSLPVENIPMFRRRLSRALREQYQETAAPLLEVAAEIQLDEVTPALADEIGRLTPFGAGNPPVVLATLGLTLVRQRFLGRERLHRQLTIRSESGAEREVLWWNGAEYALPDGPFDLAFTLGWQTYQGQREMTLTLVALRLRAPVTVVPPPQLVIEDWRATATEMDVVTAFLQQEAEGTIWAEGPHSNELREKGVLCHTRSQLVEAAALLIYTAPPAPGVLHAAMEGVKPQRVYLAAIPPAAQTLNTFLTRLLGLCKYTISHREGQMDLDALAGAAAQTAEAVYWGLRVLAAKGAICMEERGEDIQVAPPGTCPSINDEQEAEATLRALLAEAAAYRTFFSRAPADTLLT